MAVCTLEKMPRSYNFCWLSAMRFCEMGSPGERRMRLPTSDALVVARPRTRTPRPSSRRPGGIAKRGAARREEDAARPQRRLGGREASHQHAAHVLALTGVNRETEVDAMGNGSGRLAPIEGRVGISVVVVVTEERIAVSGDIGFAERLALGG